MTKIAPFTSAEAAWFWTCAMVEARHNPGLVHPGPGPCRAEDVLKCLDELYRHRRIELVDARILHYWGRRGRAPNSSVARERCDWRFWSAALDRLDFKLRQRGIVAGVPRWASQGGYCGGEE